MVECLTQQQSYGSMQFNRYPHATARKQCHSLSCEDVSPTKLLTVAIRKRRELFEEKDPDLYRELLHKSLIQHLCKQLGKGRAKSKNSRRHRSRSVSKRRRSPTSNSSSGSGSDEDTDHRPIKRSHFGHGDEEEHRLHIDESAGQGDDSSSNTGLFEITNKHEEQYSTADGAFSMVYRAPSHLDYAQMEKFLDSTADTNDKLDGYVGHWTRLEAESSSPPVATPHENPNFNSDFSLTLLQPVRSISERSGPADQDSKSTQEMDPDDPFDMKSLFQRSYSIIEASREEEVEAEETGSIVARLCEDSVVPDNPSISAAAMSRWQKCAC